MVPDRLPDFVSREVTGSRRFFLNLQASPDDPLELVCGGVERAGKAYAIDRTEFAYDAIEFVAEGYGTLMVGGREHPLVPGTVFAYRPDVPHSIRNDNERPMRKYYVDLTGRGSGDVLRAAGLIRDDGEVDVVRIGAIHELTQWFDLLIQTCTSGRMSPENLRTVGRHWLPAAACQIDALRLPPDQMMPRSHETFERARSHIDEHYAELTSVSQVAQAVGVSAVHISRLFARFADCGAHQYLMRRKMNHAAAMLMEGGLVRDVAEAMHYPDPFQFSRAFKRVHGIPPRTLLERRGRREPEPTG